MTPKALLFDVGGTVFDWKSTAIQKTSDAMDGALTHQELEAFANDWRREFFIQREQVAHGHSPWMNSDQMQILGLETLREEHPFLHKIGDLESFSKSVWHSLNVFNGAAEAITRLRTKYTCAVLTILSWESIVNSSKRAGVIWDGILSCEFLGYYKPSFQAYRRGCELIGCDPSQVMMVAAHDTDLAAARMTGMQTARVKVPEEDDIFDAEHVDADAYNFDLKVANFDELCTKLGISDLLKPTE